MPKMKPGIRTKTLLLIMAATIVPLLSLNFFWTNSQRQSLISGTQSRQELITQNDANEVNDFITAKVRTLIIHSQSPSLQQFNLPKATLEMSTLLYQDKDLTRAALVDQSGQEVVALTSNLQSSPLQNVATSDPFKVVNYYGANEYISPVGSNSVGQPSITIAIPLITFTTPQELSTLSTAESGVVRNPQDIKGALIVQVTLENLWNSVLSTTNNANNTSTPSDGYAYVVDDKGLIIAHPDAAFTNKHQDVSSTPVVALFKKNIGSTTTVSGTVQAVSEKGVQVMATYQKAPVTDWGVVFEEPMSSIYKNVSHVSNLGLTISTVVIIFMALLSMWLSRFLSQPILRIARAAERIGKGNFTEHLDMQRGDEIGALSASINAMGTNLQAFVGRIDAQRRQLEVIINSTTDGIFAVDAKGMIILANHAAAVFTERAAEKLVGDNIATIFPWTHESKPFNIDYSAPGARTFYDLQYMSPSNVVHYVNLIVVKVDDPSGTAQAIVTIHDETKNREFEDMKLDFVSMAAHELRTPLSTIRGYLELITTQPSSNENDKTHYYISQAQQSAKVLATLISNLLDVSRIERGTLVLTMDKVDLAGDVTQIVQGLQMNAKAKQIQLTYDGSDHGQYVVADSVAVREVVGNLVDNAIKYTPIGGKVTVDLTPKDTSYVLAVEDNGIGIPANALPYLFTKFYRVHGGLESGSAGTGLGLFIAKSIVERHGGTIGVKSNDGSGSVFTVTLPMFSEEKYAEVQKAKGSEVDNVNRQRGWTTKNITR